MTIKNTITFKTTFLIKTVYAVAFLFALIFSNNVFGQTTSQTFSTAGTYTFTPPEGVCSVQVECWGTGGGGGYGLYGAGGGGGGGGYSKSYGVQVVPGSTYTVVVGAGAASSYSGNLSSFGPNTVVAYGGGYGYDVTFGGGNGGNSSGYGIGNLTYAGGNGGGGISGNSSGGGGGGAGPNGSGYSAYHNNGGAAGGGTGSSAGANGVSANVNGTNVTSGNGGASGGYSTGYPTENGGTTADGRVVVTWTVPSTPVYINYTSVDCSQEDLYWTYISQNTSSILVCEAGSPVSGIPVDGTNYTANSAYGSGSPFPGGGFVVFNGNNRGVNITGLSAGITYYLKVFDFNDCTEYVYVHTNELTGSFVTTGMVEAAPVLNSNALCRGSSNGSATAAIPTNGVAPYTYKWNNGTTSTNQTNSALARGTYTVYVTDINGCTGTSSGTVTITEPVGLMDNNPTLNSNPNCFGENGSATAAIPTGGTSPYTYQWNGGTSSTNATNSALSAGTYTVNVTDNHGCTVNSPGTVIIRAPNALTDGSPVRLTNANCYGENGSARVSNPNGGTAPYTYAWNSGTTSTNTTNTALSAGTYTVNITDAHGCTASSSSTVTITAPAALTEGIPIHNSDITCSGNNNGAATAAAPSGGTSPYTYAWNGGTTSTNTTNTALSAGTYTVNITDAHGCTASSSGTVTITAPAVLTEGIPIHNSDITCSGNNNGTATAATPSGGTAPYTYQWNNASSSTNATNSTLSVGTFSVEVTDANGCTATSSGTVTITAPSVLTEGTPTHNSDITCSGNNNGAATAATPSGGTAPYTYQWNNGSSNTNPTNSTLSAGTFSVEVTDAHGCTATSSGTVTITAPAVLTEGIPIHNSDITCSGNNNGAATAATPSGGTAPYTYAWNGGTTSTNTTNTVLSAGTYTVNITDAHGCTATSSGTVTITAPSALTEGIPIHNSDITCSGNNNGTATAATPSGGTAPYTYQWNNGSSNTNPTNSTLSAGTFSVEVTDAHGCTATSSGTVTITAPAALTEGIPIHNSDITCSGNNNGTATAAIPIGGTAPYTYRWNNGSSNTNPTNTTLSAGTFSVEVTDAHGCTATSSGTVTITAPSALTEGTPTHNSDVTCNGSNNGSATAATPSGGTAPYTYQWNNASSSINATNSTLSVGTFSVEVTDANGCTATSSGTVTITAPAALTEGIPIHNSDITCSGNNNGTATAATPSGGTAPYTYQWNNGSSNTNPTNSTLSAGTFSVEVTDAHGCTATSSGTVTITAPSALTEGTPTHNSDVTCNGNNNGSATAATPSGGTAPYTYQWNNGSSNTNATNSTLSAGTFSVEVTDANGCAATSSGTVTITAPSALTEGTPTHNSDVTCNGSNNGSATAAIPTGGTSPYTYLWSDATSATTASVSNLSAGTYSVTVQDANTCSATASVIITQPTLLIANANVATNVTGCYGNSNGSALSAPSGGTSPYTYTWNDANTTITASVSNLSAGSYNVILHDSNGCSANGTVTITQPSLLTANATVSANVTGCYGNSNGSALSAPSGGVSPYTYTWSDANTTTTANVSNLSAGNYNVVVYDSNRCSATGMVTITQPSLLVANATVLTNISCNGNSNGSALSAPSGGTGAYTYSWSDVNSQTTARAINLSAGTYSVTVHDANECSATASVTITQPSAFLYATAGTISEVICNGRANGHVSVSPVGGNLPYTYSWSNGTSTVATTQAPNTMSAGSYTVTVQDNCGVTHTSTAVVTQPNGMRDSVKTSTSVGCNGGTGGSIALGAKGGNYPYNYLWSSGSTLVTASGLSAGTYSVVVTDTKGCTNTVTGIVVTQPTLLSSNISTNCIGNRQGTLTITGSGGTPAYKYTWSNGKTTSSITVADGNYTVKVSDAHSCSATNSVTVACPGALNGEGGGDGSEPSVCCETMENITLYPNPNSGQFTVAITPDSYRDYELGIANNVEIYNMLGQRIYSQSEIRNSKFVINISDQPNGIYLMRILDNNGNLVSQKKVVKTN